MTVTIQDVLKANLVLVGISLLNKPADLEKFKDTVDSEVVGRALIPNISSSVAEAARVFTLQKDRISLDLSPSRSVISRDYPQKDNLDRLARVAALAISNTDLEGRTSQAFGYNIELVCEQDSGRPAFAYLAERLFAPNFSANEGWKLVGGAGKLLFESNGKRWLVSVEPRFGEEASERIFLSLNLHIGGGGLPNEAEITNSLLETWEQAHSFLSRLDERHN